MLRHSQGVTCQKRLVKTQPPATFETPVPKERVLQPAPGRSFPINPNWPISRARTLIIIKCIKLLNLPGNSADPGRARHSWERSGTEAGPAGGSRPRSSPRAAHPRPSAPAAAPPPPPAPALAPAPAPTCAQGHGGAQQRQCPQRGARRPPHRRASAPGAGPQREAAGRSLQPGAGPAGSPPPPPAGQL